MKVNDVRADGLLTLKLDAGKAASSKSMPEFPLCGCHPASQKPCLASFEVWVGHRKR
jgi:hypothetical protein